ncbi:unnamed protein product [Ambrosiozyma monospora]|uniref:Unnamed protein product n=1 Tax=Ambrosiozyma monospora TaxID=43982 RepID=A0ACB5U4E2_AMBMO|nr:unnamed protein product [Ambrosiozyma monospora]
MRASFTILLLAMAAISHCVPHGPGSDQHPQQANAESEFNEPIPPEFHGSWQKWHMKVEHDFDEADPESVFVLHDTRSIGKLSAFDILRMYGLQRDEVVGKGDGMGSHDDTEFVSKELKEKIVNQVLSLMDTNGDGEIDKQEWLAYSSKGGEFPDFGIGSGHEYDFEEEYEKHHWLKYHAENDPDSLVQHAEDVEHELLHHLHDIEHHAPDDSLKVHTARYPIRDDNIPDIFKAGL